MKKLRFLIAILIVTTVAMNIQAQEVIKPPKYPDGIYTKENTRTRRAIPYAHLREADVMWSKRVWRVIDLREKMNLSGSWSFALRVCANGRRWNIPSGSTVKCRLSISKR